MKKPFCRPLLLHRYMQVLSLQFFCKLVGFTAIKYFPLLYKMTGMASFMRQFLQFFFGTLKTSFRRLVIVARKCTERFLSIYVAALRILQKYGRGRFCLQKGTGQPSHSRRKPIGTQFKYTMQIRLDVRTNDACMFTVCMPPPKRFAPI